MLDEEHPDFGEYSRVIRTLDVPHRGVRNITVFNFEVQCPHGPWGRDSPEDILMYGSIDDVRRRFPNAKANVRFH